MRFRRRKASVAWLPTLWQTGTSATPGFSLGFGALVATPIVSAANQGDVSADNAQLFNSPFRKALECRLQRLIGDITFDLYPLFQGTSPLTDSMQVHYGFAVLRTQPQSGTAFDLQDWDVSDFSNQKRWLWRRSMTFQFVANQPIISAANAGYLPWGSWHDIKPRCNVRFGEEDLYLITLANINGGGVPTQGGINCRVNLRTLWSFGR